MGGWREQRKAKVKGIVGEWNIYPKLRTEGKKSLEKGIKCLKSKKLFQRSKCKRAAIKYNLELPIMPCLKR